MWETNSKKYREIRRMFRYNPYIITFRRIWENEKKGNCFLIGFNYGGISACGLWKKR